jgi:hypothetical protein
MVATSVILKNAKGNQWHNKRKFAQHGQPDWKRLLTEINE